MPEGQRVDVCKEKKKKRAKRGQMVSVSYQVKLLYTVIREILGF